MNLIEYYLELDSILRDYSSTVISSDSYYDGGPSWTLEDYKENEIPSSYLNDKFANEEDLLESLRDDFVIPNSYLEPWVQKIISLNLKTNSSVPKLTEEQVYEMLRMMNNNRYKFALPSSWC